MQSLHTLIAEMLQPSDGHDSREHSREHSGEHSGEDVEMVPETETEPLAPTPTVQQEVQHRSLSPETREEPIVFEQVVATVQHSTETSEESTFTTIGKNSICPRYTKTKFPNSNF